MLIERFSEESARAMKTCSVCKMEKNFLHFTFIQGNQRDDICGECINKVPKHIPEVQIEKYLEQREWKKNRGIIK